MYWYYLILYVLYMQLFCDLKAYFNIVNKKQNAYVHFTSPRPDPLFAQL